MTFFVVLWWCDLITTIVVIHSIWQHAKAFYSRYFEKPFNSTAASNASVNRVSIFRLTNGKTDNAGCLATILQFT